MWWPILSFLCLAAGAALHLWWRARFLRAQWSAREEIEKLKQNQKQSALQNQTQQEALFNSMAEGLLLLDQAGRIQLANRAFLELFGVTADIRSRKIGRAHV